MSLSGFEVYRYYLSLKLHFSSPTYDVIAAGGKTNVGQTAYTKRNDRALFEYLSKKFSEPREVIKYFIANFAYNHDNVLYDKEVGYECLTKWIKTKESLSKVFHDDLEKLVAYTEKHKVDIKLCFEPSKKGIDCIMKLYRSGVICVETVVLIHQFDTGLVDAWSEFPENKLIFESEFLRIRKLASFVVPTSMCIDVWEKFIVEHLH